MGPIRRRDVVRGIYVVISKEKKKKSKSKNLKNDPYDATDVVWAVFVIVALFHLPCCVVFIN